MLSMILSIQVQIGLSLPSAGTSYPGDYFARGEVFLAYLDN